MIYISSKVINENVMLHVQCESVYSLSSPIVSTRDTVICAA